MHNRGKAGSDCDVLFRNPRMTLRSVTSGISAVTGLRTLLDTSLLGDPINRSISGRGKASNGRTVLARRMASIRSFSFRGLAEMLGRDGKTVKQKDAEKT